MYETKRPPGQAFNEGLIDELQRFLTECSRRFPREETLKIDLHCHDHNSDKPTELLGRMLKLPETWLPTERLIEVLGQHGCDVFTITNHNNARSIWALKEAGVDVLSGAEFTCTVPDFSAYVHVLTYGFTPEEEADLNRLRRNVYDFQEYTRERDIPTVWAHPLYYYTTRDVLPLAFFRKMSLIFERFEVLNGQRNTWQNMLVKCWVESLTPDRIAEFAREANIDPARFCRRPFERSMVGGSDSHMGIFCGLTGTHLHVPALRSRRAQEPLSELAREALLEGRVAAFGSHNGDEKLTVAFLDYLCQMAIHQKDSGLLRILLHEGTVREKVLALLVTNALAELKRHKLTMNFVKLFHSGVAGARPYFVKRWFVPKEYRAAFDDITRIAIERNNNPQHLAATCQSAVFSVHDRLYATFMQRIAQRVQQLVAEIGADALVSNECFQRIELPSQFRELYGAASPVGASLTFSPQESPSGDDLVKWPKMPEVLDGLPFPFLASSLILGAHFTATRVLYEARPLLSQFARELGKFPHPVRVLWLTDTFNDDNGVSMSLKAKLREIKGRRLPIDLLVCSDSVQSEAHLAVVRPVAEFAIPVYRQQSIRIPNFLDIHRMFQEGEYDRIICSTEGPMGLAALYLKQAYNVPAYFYVHTDWVEFARRVLDFDSSNISRLRRFLRAFYRNFDGLFVLNTDQKKWLCGRGMGFPAHKVKLTSHWRDEHFRRRRVDRFSLLGTPHGHPVMLFAGRLSLEKGTAELTQIYREAKVHVPDLELVIVGRGPAESELREELPEARFLGWIEHADMPEIYSASDLLVMPSRFDTFGNVVLEAMSCGCPSVVYRAKGPKDIVVDGKTGFVVDTRAEFIQRSIQLLTDPKLLRSFQSNAQKRADDHYSVDVILERFLKDIGLSIPGRVKRAA